MMWGRLSSSGYRTAKFIRGLQLVAGRRGNDGVEALFTLIMAFACLLVYKLRPYHDGRASHGPIDATSNSWHSSRQRIRESL